MDEVEAFKKIVKVKKKPAKQVDYLSTGSTLLNLACSGTPTGGFQRGSYHFLVGDSASGKSFLSLTCMAEASINPIFADYRLIFDDAENRMLMNIEKFFGSKVKERLEPPRVSLGSPVYSSSIEEFYYHLDDALDKKIPFIYVLDSMDALTSEDEVKKFEQHKKAFRKREDQEDEGKEVATPGSYGDGKAKKNAANLRRVIPKLKRSGSILIIINQTRDNIGAFTFEKKTRSGGHALRFYATLELWSSIREKLKKTVRGEQRSVGVQCKVQVKKNCQTGKECSVEIPIYYSVGIDDVGSCVDYLISEKHWSKSGASITAKEFDFKGSKEKLIEHIGESNLEDKLKELVTTLWNEIEEACRVKRKSRYE